jgi:hypothetical protein
MRGSYGHPKSDRVNAVIASAVPEKIGKMIMSDANQLRLIAAEIIHKLYDTGDVTQLELLEMQAKRSIEEIKKRSEGNARG